MPTLLMSDLIAALPPEMHPFIHQTYHDDLTSYSLNEHCIFARIDFLQHTNKKSKAYRIIYDEMLKTDDQNSHLKNIIQLVINKMQFNAPFSEADQKLFQRGHVAVTQLFANPIMNDRFYCEVSSQLWLFLLSHYQRLHDNNQQYLIEMAPTLIANKILSLRDIQHNSQLWKEYYFQILIVFLGLITRCDTNGVPLNDVLVQSILNTLNQLPIEVFTIIEFMPTNNFFQPIAQPLLFSFIYALAKPNMNIEFSDRIKLFRSIYTKTKPEEWLWESTAHAHGNQKGPSIFCLLLDSYMLNLNHPTSPMLGDLITELSENLPIQNLWLSKTTTIKPFYKLTSLLCECTKKLEIDLPEDEQQTLLKNTTKNFTLFVKITSSSAMQDNHWAYKFAMNYTILDVFTLTIADVNIYLNQRVTPASLALLTLFLDYIKTLPPILIKKIVLTTLPSHNPLIISLLNSIIDCNDSHAAQLITDFITKTIVPHTNIWEEQITYGLLKNNRDLNSSFTSVEFLVKQFYDALIPHEQPAFKYFLTILTSLIKKSNTCIWETSLASSAEEKFPPLINILIALHKSQNEHVIKLVNLMINTIPEDVWRQHKVQINTCINAPTSPKDRTPELTSLYNKLKLSISDKVSKSSPPPKSLSTKIIAAKTLTKEALASLLNTITQKLNNALITNKEKKIAELNKLLDSAEFVCIQNEFLDYLATQIEVHRQSPTLWMTLKRLSKKNNVSSNFMDKSLFNLVAQLRLLVLKNEEVTGLELPHQSAFDVILELLANVKINPAAWATYHSIGQDDAVNRWTAATLLMDALYYSKDAQCYQALLKLVDTIMTQWPPEAWLNGLYYNGNEIETPLRLLALIRHVDRPEDATALETFNKALTLAPQEAVDKACCYQRDTPESASQPQCTVRDLSHGFFNTAIPIDTRESTNGINVDRR